MNTLLVNLMTVLDENKSGLTDKFYVDTGKHIMETKKKFDKIVEHVDTIRGWNKNARESTKKNLIEFDLLKIKFNKKKKLILYKYSMKIYLRHYSYNYVEESLKKQKHLSKSAIMEIQQLDMYQDDRLSLYNLFEHNDKSSQIIITSLNYVKPEDTIPYDLDLTIENDDDIFDDLHDMIHENENESINDDDEIPRRIIVVVDSEDDSTDDDSTDDDSTDDDIIEILPMGINERRQWLRRQLRGAR